MALVVLDRKPLPTGMVEITLSDGTNRVTVTVTLETEMSPDSQSLYEVMFIREQERLGKARRIAQPGGPY